MKAMHHVGITVCDLESIDAPLPQNALELVEIAYMRPEERAAGIRAYLELRDQAGSAA
jgi:hypothetical protein